MMFDPEKQRMRKAWALVMTLSYSRYPFVRFVYRINIENWIDCHIRAFEFFSGVPKKIILDNLKAGARWLGEIVKTLGIKFVYNPIDIGVRVAFLVKVSLTEPLKNTNQHGESIALQATTIGGGKPILQRLGDLKSGKRSTWSRIERSYVKPTLLDATPGDISMALPYRFVKDILEGLHILDRLFPGVGDDSTLLYTAEIKFHGLKVLTDKFLRASIPSISVAGDGAGLSRGIVGAAVSGLLSARGALERNF